MLVYECGNIPLHCYRCLPWDYTGVNIQGVLLFVDEIGEGGKIPRENERNIFPLDFVEIKLGKQCNYR